MCVCVCVCVCVCSVLPPACLGAFGSADLYLLPVRSGPSFLQPCNSWEHWLYHLQQLNQYFNGKLQRKWVFGNQRLPTESRKIKKDCTSPRRERPRNWLPIHLLYSFTYFIANIFSFSPWLLILNCFPFPSLYLPCLPAPPHLPLLPGLPNDTVCAINDVADESPEMLLVFSQPWGEQMRRREMSSSWKMIWRQAKPRWPLTAGLRLYRGATENTAEGKAANKCSIQKGSRSEARIDLKAWITDLRPHSPSLNWVPVN